MTHIRRGADEWPCPRAQPGPIHGAPGPSAGRPKLESKHHPPPPPSRMNRRHKQQNGVGARNSTPKSLLSFHRDANLALGCGLLPGGKLTRCQHPDTIIHGSLYSECLGSARAGRVLLDGPVDVFLQGQQRLGQARVMPDKSMKPN